MARPRKFQPNSALDVEIPLTLKLSQRQIDKLSKSGRYGVRNSIASISKYALEPAAEQAARLSGLSIGRSEKKFGTAKGEMAQVLYGSDIQLRTARRTHYMVKSGKKTVRRRILSYRAGMRKKNAYRMRGRADRIGDVTLLLGVDTRKNYYNWLANLWEHGWANPYNRHPGNQFMTKAVLDALPAIRDRFARGVRAAVASEGKRIRSSDLRKLG